MSIKLQTGTCCKFCKFVKYEEGEEREYVCTWFDEYCEAFTICPSYEELPLWQLS